MELFSVPAALRCHSALEAALVLHHAEPQKQLPPIADPAATTIPGAENAARGRPHGSHTGGDG